MSERTAPVESDTPFRYTAELADSIETAWQDRWEELGTFHADNPVGELRGTAPSLEEATAAATSSSEKMYIMDMFPYPSGSGLHVGHPLGYIATDVVARHQRMLGKNVLYTMGYDAFGLPAEQYAVQTGQHPRISTEANIANMRRQLRRLGLGHDDRRAFATIDPDYYRWTQWLFLQFWQRGLAYRKNSPVNWCPKDQTVLANEQVVDGRGWRTGQTWLMASSRCVP